MEKKNYPFKTCRVVVKVNLISLVDLRGVGWGRIDLVEPPKTKISQVQKIANVINSLTP